MYDHEHVFIGGRWTKPDHGRRMDMVSPHSEEVFGTVVLASEADVDTAVGAARDAFDDRPWAKYTPQDRFKLVARLGELYQARVNEISELISLEIGSPISFARVAQGPSALLTITAMLDAAERVQWEETRSGALGGEFVVRREPVGVVGAIIPWNAPQGLAMPKLAAALLTGCAIVIKPAPETALDALVLAELIEAAGVPEGVVSILPAGPEVGEYLVRHPGVDKVAFTGSTDVGRRIGAICGEQLKRVSLELGGKSAAILLEDVDLDMAISGLKVAGLMNNGQVCAAQTRILAPRSRYDEVVDGLAAMVADLTIGDPADPATEIGPLVSQRQQQRVAKYIALGQEEGAKVAAGGTGRPRGTPKGWYVQPTVFAGDNSMRIAREEIFGPVLTVIAYDGEADAIDIANDSPYGLAGSVWTADTARGMEVARQVRAGTYGINTYTADLNGPFGGYKSSGIGREHGPEGLDSYLELKSIVDASLSLGTKLS
jgi:aldehyde dehydrogenase (NAD+)